MARNSFLGGPLGLDPLGDDWGRRDWEHQLVARGKLLNDGFRYSVVSPDGAIRGGDLRHLPSFASPRSGIPCRKGWVTPRHHGLGLRAQPRILAS